MDERAGSSEDQDRGTADEGHPTGFNSTGGFLLVIAVLAVMLGLLVAALPLGILFGIVALPAILVAEALARHGKWSGIPQGTVSLFACLIWAFVGVATVEIAAFIAFCIVCFPIAALDVNRRGWPNQGTAFFGMGCGLLAFLVTALLLGRRFWPKP